jgi:hypothetical protein
MPSRRDTDRARDRKRSVQAMEAAEDVLPAVVRSCLRAGLTPDALRAVFERALGDWREPCAPSSDSGDDRQDLDDLARVLSIWHTDPRFVDRDGEPRKLRQSGRAPSFEALARIAIPSVPAQEALKRLLIVGVVEIDSRDRVRVLRRELVTQQWDELGLWNWKQAARRHLETLEFNYTVPGEGRFERTARTERLPVQSLPLFNRWVREQGADFVQMVDDWLIQHEGPVPVGEDPDAITAGVGVYLFVDEPDGQP